MLKEISESEELIGTDTSSTGNKKGDDPKMSIRGFVQQARRILKLAKKPDRKEVWLTAKVCALGIILIGAFAFVVHLIFIVVGFHP